MNSIGRLAAILGSIAVLELAAAWFASSASAQGSHHGLDSVGIAVSSQELTADLAHGMVLGACVFLAGLVAFVTLVWLPTSRVEDVYQEKVISSFRRWMWILVGLLFVAGLVELPVYAVRASGETLSFGLVREALFETRVGQIWIERIVFELLTATAATYAATKPRYPIYWWGAIAASAVLLSTLTRQSHAAVEDSLLPFAVDWLHTMAASLWMGGLLGFPILLLGPLRAMPTEARMKLLGRTVRRFSKVAMIAVMALIITGLYAALLHVPSLSALVGTPYGRALIIKLGILVFLLAFGAQNLRLQGREPFGLLVSLELVFAIGIFVATGLLTSLPPATDVAEQQTVEQNSANSAQDIRQPVVPQPPMPKPRSTLET